MNAGTGGDVIASDDIAGVKYQRVKLSLGADGAASDAPIGGGTESGVLRVTLASDSTGVLSVDDNGGSLTVDVGTALPAGTNNIGDVDVLSVVPGTGATNSGKAVDSAAGATDTGFAALAVRDDTLSTLTPADGDYTHLRVDSTGALHVRVSAGGIAGKAEDAAHTDGDEGVVILAVRRDSAAVGSGTDGDYSTVNVDASGRLWSIAAQSGTWTVQPGNTANTTAWLVSPRPATSGGLTIFRSIDLDESEEEIKATAGQLYGYYFANTNAAARYLKFYNATAANVTVGTTTPVLTFYLPPTSAGHVEFSHGIAFGTAITAAATTGVADNDTGAPGANEVILNAFYA